MRIEQFVGPHEAVVLPVRDTLVSLPSGLTLHHATHGLRHPLGMYNTSIANVTNRIKRSLDVLTDGDKQSGFLRSSETSWEENLLERHDAVLDSLMEHMDDCLNVLSCFFTDIKSRNRHAEVKKYKSQIAGYRTHIGQLVNHIKHKQGRLRLVVFYSPSTFVPGYFAETAGPDGSIGPHSGIHEGGNTAFSFHRDLRYHLANIFLTSHHLKTSIENVLNRTTSVNRNRSRIFR